MTTPESALVGCQGLGSADQQIKHLATEPETDAADTACRPQQTASSKSTKLFGLALHLLIQTEDLALCNHLNHC